MKEPEALAAEHFEGKILGHVTNFYGICPDCLKRYDVNASCVVRNKIENQKIFKIILTIREAIC